LRPSPRLPRLVADLEADDFDCRERAATELATEPAHAEALLRARLADKPPLDLKRRIEELLPTLDGPARIQATRLCGVLEAIGTPEARRLLDEWSRGDPESPRVQEARAARSRLPG